MHILSLKRDPFFCIVCLLIAPVMSIPVEHLFPAKETREVRKTGDVQSLFVWTLYNSTLYYQTTPKYDRLRDYRFNFTIIGILITGIIFSIVVVRICFFLCSPTRHSNIIVANSPEIVLQSQVATIASPHVKPDLPPSYSEAVLNSSNYDWNKLPSYDELQERQQESRTRQT